MASYWVIGGEYRDTEFRDLAPGAEEVRRGPFATLAEAREVWAELSWRAVDNCNTRYVIRKEDEAAGDP